MDSKFGLAFRKMEGESINEQYGLPKDYSPPKELYATTWVEAPMPVALEKMAHQVLSAMYKQWLFDNGFPEEND